jgi:tRNA pseudouridine38-40 synthase
VGPAAPGRLACYEITGSGFLRHMVRNIAGTLVEIGRGRRTPDDLSVLLASRDRARAAATAPAHGLVLWQIDY